MLLSIFILIISISALFFYKKFTESEKAYYELHLINMKLENDNKILINRINDLESYKNDISKTVYLLDNSIKEMNDNYTNKENTKQEQEKEKEDEYLQSINNNTLIMDKSIIENLINEMPEIINDKDIEINELKDINSLNYAKYRI